MTACASSPCQHGGQCAVTNTSLGFRCSCPAGYVGFTCQQRSFSSVVFHFICVIVMWLSLKWEHLSLRLCRFPFPRKRVESERAPRGTQLTQDSLTVSTSELFSRHQPARRLSLCLRGWLSGHDLHSRYKFILTRSAVTHKGWGCGRPSRAASAACWWPAMRARGLMRTWGVAWPKAIWYYPNSCLSICVQIEVCAGCHILVLGSDNSLLTQVPG